MPTEFKYVLVVPKSYQYFGYPRATNASHFGQFPLSIIEWENTDLNLVK